MLKETTSLVGAIEKWVFAIQCEEFDLARIIAKDMLSDGATLIQHVDFDRCLRTHFECANAQELLQSLSGFLACVTDAREVAVRARE